MPNTLNRPGAVAQPLPAQLESEEELTGLKARKTPGPLGFGQDLKHLEQPSTAISARAALLGKIHKSTKLSTAELLNELSLRRQGRSRRRYTSEEERRIKLASFISDSLDNVSYQLTKGDKSGIEWYGKDIDTLEIGLHKLFQTHPDFKPLAGSFGKPDEKGFLTSNPLNPLANPRMVLFKAVMAPTSMGNTPNVNLLQSLRAIKHAAHAAPSNPFANIPLVNPENGGGWSIYGQTVGDLLDRLNRLVREKGELGAAHWLLARHPVQDLRKYKPNLDERTDLHYGNPSETAYPGSYIWGPKIGAFFLNLNRNPSHLTKDMWFSRSWYRIMGSLLKDTPKGREIQDFPKDNDRPLMDEAVGRAARSLGITPSEFQAVLWYYEQSLYTQLSGRQSNSGSYADAIAKALSRAGLDGLPATPNRGGPDEAARQAAIASATARRLGRIGRLNRLSRSAWLRRKRI